MAYQQAYSDNDGTSPASISVTVTAGDALVALVMHDGASGPSTFNIGGTVGGTWEELTGGAVNDNTSFPVDQRVYINRSPSAGTGTVTASNNLGNLVWPAVWRLTQVPSGALSGVATAVVSVATPASGANAATSGNHTPPTTGNWIQIGFAASWNAGGQPTVGTGFTDTGTQNFDYGGSFSEGQYRTGSGNTAVAATFTRAAADKHVITSIIVAQEGAAAAASLVPPTAGRNMAALISH